MTRGIGARVRAALAAAIAPGSFTHATRVGEELARLDALGLTDDKKHQVLAAATQLYACGASEDLVAVIAKIAATGRLANGDLHALQHAGIRVEIRHRGGT
jgi:hypothetical protein